MPFDLPGVKPGSDLEKLFKAIGFVVVQWGSAEQSLDLMVANIFYCFNGDPSLKKRPRNLEPKVKFLQERFAEFPELAQFRAESETLFSRFLEVGKKRNDLVHGGMASLSIENGQFILLKLDVSPTGHHIRSVVLDEVEWPAFRKELLRLGKDGLSLAKRVSDSLKARA
jgi:hypothetical protein